MKYSTVLIAVVAAATVLSSGSVSAKQINSADATSGVGCYVADADGNYTFDGSCTWHLVVQRNKDGSLKNYSYQDNGQLPDAAPHPTSARINPVSVDFGGGIVCFGQEITQPSGQYKSDCHI